MQRTLLTITTAVVIITSSCTPEPAVCDLEVSTCPITSIESVVDDQRELSGEITYDDLERPTQYTRYVGEALSYDLEVDRNADQPTVTITSMRRDGFSRTVSYTLTASNDTTMTITSSDDVSIRLALEDGRLMAWHESRPTSGESVEVKLYYGDDGQVLTGSRHTLIPDGQDSVLLYDYVYTGSTSIYPPLPFNPIMHGGNTLLQLELLYLFGIGVGDLLPTRHLGTGLGSALPVEPRSTLAILTEDDSVIEITYEGNDQADVSFGLRLYY